MQQALARMLSPISRRVRLMISRAVVKAVNDATKLQGLQVRLLGDEVRDSVERFQNYGHSACPHAGAEAIYLSVGGARDHGVVICVDDRRFRLQNLKPGESALYDDLGQVVHLTRDGIVIQGAGLPIRVIDTPEFTLQAGTKVRIETATVELVATEKVRAETPQFEVTGEIKDNCDAPAGRTMSAMRDVYDAHTHHENNPVNGDTAPPTQRMSP
jgi:phage baseplate assembly protein V